MRAAYRLPEKEGMAKLREQADWLEKSYPSAAASLREGLAETFTIRDTDLYVQPSWTTSHSAAMPGDYYSAMAFAEPAGKSQRGYAAANAACDPLARHENDPPLGSGGIPGDRSQMRQSRKALPPHHGVPVSMDAGRCVEEGEGGGDTSKLGARSACGGLEQMWSTDLTPLLSGGRIQRESCRTLHYVGEHGI